MALLVLGLATVGQPAAAESAAALSLQPPAVPQSLPQQLPAVPPAGSAVLPGSPPLPLTALSALLAAPDRARIPGAEELEALHRLYRPLGYTPLWSGADGRPGRSAADALLLLSAAGDEGLDPADYRVEALAAGVAHLRDAAAPDEAQRAALDIDLSVAMLRYLRHLQRGRVDPREFGFRMPPRTGEPDAADLLRAALPVHGLRDAVAASAPQSEPYLRLREELRRYRSLAAEPGAAVLPPGPDVRPGERLAGAASLHRRLVALGDLPADARPPSRPAYEAALVEGVRRFQRRHGLRDNGVLGAETRAALNVPLSRRVRQIELALERMRWLPPPDGRPFLAVNIAMFRLAAWDASPGRAPALGMDVIVGGSLDTQTPVLAEEMRYLVFRPYWDVPRSIVRKEILPGLALDPGYLDRMQMEIVRGAGDRAPVVAATPENIERLRQGRDGLRVRQRPGPHNSLGLVKFIFPNDQAVYLHGTPSRRLFSRTRRDLSHGCVRLRDPAALAQWVLRDQPEWTRERIEAAMAAPRPLRVNLTQPLPVRLLYYTAEVNPESGALHFAADIYGHDRRLEAALARRSAGTAAGD
ncbi:L,D-transpeptidase family protein [Caldimonas tepidiphila]|uniref:L,D-transpeptidase family protein n=1 Tax=Caldimonas tepidiphila TaxID=2315841 RepID=UPI000E5B8F93|nr:L,D-transpeptidase family protein [Caldimonas tepidiphila]